MKITIIRLSSYGDIALTEPIFRALKELNFQTVIIVKKKFYDIVKNNPFIDEILLYEDLRALNAGKLKTDYLIDLQLNIASKTILKRIKAVRKVRIKKYYFQRFLYVNFHINIHFPSVIERYRQVIEKAIGKTIKLEPIEFFPAERSNLNIEKPFITLALTSKWRTKSYPYQRELIDLILKSTKLNIALVGKNNIKLKDKRLINLNTDYPIDETAGIIKESKLLISTDSLWMHIGIGLDIPTIAIFGSTTPELGFISDYNKPKIILQRKLHCRPCTKIGKKRCPLGHFKCMKLITPEKILRVIKNECNC